ncbi:hypothetical protein ASPVEDRAFT_40381 [Aspergillus versicolor CBS 583.65]|uniref:Rhodopsin domain-containing protein n=1 Tax=Aspergillus versicolor CBS 583.65 TaxID=1036611 RepID=A0A1L9PHD7_ASPVE|nr:uncharacterized protein ASPVEDRAFT_40381 [Aspergillus versicolor CBS 583.65]OJJ00876.1 hypothetical protein ASPVEDRAFT_40381 [Aspergillus versicolor CBS 583.65]
MSSSSTYPPGIRSPLATDNENNHSGLIVVITSFYLVLTLFSISARLFTLHRKRLVQLDDFVFAFLVIISFCQLSVVLRQVHYGWGTRGGPSTLETRESMLKTGYAADILSIVALGSSKIATCLFYEALFSQLQRRIIRTVLTAVIVWTLMSIFLVAIRCSSHPWRDITDQCSSLYPRWQAITGLDITTEVLLVAYSGWAIHNVRIPLRKQIMVFLALGCRIVLVPLSALRLHYTKSQLTSSTPILSGAYTTTTTEIYLSLSIVCLVTSSMKFIIAVYEDQDGISYTDGSAKWTWKSKEPVSTDSSNPKSPSYSLGAGDRARLVKDSAGDPGSSSGGLKILRSVQWSVEDEAIELDERRAGAPARPFYEQLRY